MFKQVTSLGRVEMSPEEVTLYEAQQTEPELVTMPDLEPWRFFSMLDLSGKRGDLDAFIAALPEPDQTVAKAKLEYSLVFKRDNDLVLSAQLALGLSDEDLDALWLQAAGL